VVPPIAPQVTRLIREATATDDVVAQAGHVGHVVIRSDCHAMVHFGTSWWHECAQMQCRERRVAQQTRTLAQKASER
jgi:hypothetical protein